LARTATTRQAAPVVLGGSAVKVEGGRVHAAEDGVATRGIADGRSGVIVGSDVMVAAYNLLPARTVIHICEVDVAQAIAVGTAAYRIYAAAVVDGGGGVEVERHTHDAPYITSRRGRRKGRHERRDK